jgi:hypothetical protein
MRQRNWIVRFLVLATVVVIASCGGSGTSGDDTSDRDASVPGDGSGSGSSGDGGIDAPPVSHAPCPTCCDPIAQTGCGAGEACYHDEASTQLTYCAPVGTAPINGACVNDSSCSAGLDCTYPSQFGKCRKFCTLNTDCPGTPGMTQCALGTKPPENPYGVCF